MIRSRNRLGFATALILGSALSGCEHVPVVGNVYNTATAKIRDPDEYPATDAQILAIPYASLGCQFEGQAKAVMVLATTDETTFNWVSRNRVTISTQNELIVATEGLPRDLIQTVWLKPDPVRTIMPGQTIGPDIYRIVDVRNRSETEKNVQVKSTYVNRGETSVTILGVSHVAWLIEEKARFEAWRWSVTNRYWIDPETRKMLRASQQFTPELNPVSIEVLNPYG